MQGKPRDVIVRELQRTNLNVNEAVNNLLSRDDEEGLPFLDYKKRILCQKILLFPSFQNIKYMRKEFMKYDFHGYILVLYNIFIRLVLLLFCR